MTKLKVIIILSCCLLVSFIFIYFLHSSLNNVKQQLETVKCELEDKDKVIQTLQETNKQLNEERQQANEEKEKEMNYVETITGDSLTIDFSKRLLNIQKESNL